MSDASFQDVWYDSDDGLRLYARDYPTDNASLTVLCMHGLTRNSADFEDIADTLSANHRVIAVDQRGRGRSQWDGNSANYTPARYVADMFTLINVLQLENVVLLGTSMGGLMSMLMVAMQPQQFRGVILNDIGPVVAQAGLDRIKNYVGKSEPVDTLERAIEQTAAVNGLAFPDYRPADWEKWVHRTYATDEDGRLALLYDPTIAEPMGAADENAVPPDTWPLFDAMTALPLLTLRGELSDILEPDCVAEMQRRHPAMHFVTVPRVGHAPMLDEPLATEAIERFLAYL